MCDSGMFDMTRNSPAVYLNFIQAKSRKQEKNLMTAARIIRRNDVPAEAVCTICADVLTLSCG